MVNAAEKGNCREWEVGSGKWGVGRINKNNLLNTVSSILTPNPMLDVGFLQEFYFLTKISKNYLLTLNT